MLLSAKVFDGVSVLFSVAWMQEEAQEILRALDMTSVRPNIMAGSIGLVDRPE